MDIDVFPGLPTTCAADIGVCFKTPDSEERFEEIDVDAFCTVSSIKPVLQTSVICCDL
jgi:hypothetical protein